MWHLIIACALSLCSTDPIDKLEREVRSLDKVAPIARLDDAEKLQQLLQTRLGVKVEDAGIWGALGVTNRAERLIVLNTSMSPKDRYAVLAHEGGHMLEPDGLTNEESEVFAQAVALLVLGDDARTFAAYLHLSNAKSGLHVLKTYRREIQWAARVLSGR